jgi:hypothetical protein
MLQFVESRELRIVIGDKDRQQAGRIGGVFADAVLAARLLHCSMTAVRRRQQVQVSLRVVDNEAMQYVSKVVVDRNGMQQRLGQRRLESRVVAIVRLPLHDQLPVAAGQIAVDGLEPEALIEVDTTTAVNQPKRGL